MRNRFKGYEIPRILRFFGAMTPEEIQAKVSYKPTLENIERDLKDLCKLGYIKKSTRKGYYIYVKNH